MVGIIAMIALLIILFVGDQVGRLLVARMFGFQTPVFGIGLPLGPYVVIARTQDIQFRLHALCVGSYVSIPELLPGQQDPNTALLSKPIRHFPVWQRLLVSVSGTCFYVLFAWLVMFASLSVFGDAVTRVVVHGLSPNNPIAANAGVQVGDQIIQIDAAKQVATTDDVVSYLTAHPAQPVILHVLSKGQPVGIELTPNSQGKVGMALVDERQPESKKIGIGEAAVRATQKLCWIVGADVNGLGAWLRSKVTPGSKEMEMHGALAVFIIGSQIATQDRSMFCDFVAMICLSLAFLNLVPWRGSEVRYLIGNLLQSMRGTNASSG